MKKTKYLFLVIFLGLIIVTPIIGLADDSNTQNLFSRTTSGCSQITNFSSFVNCAIKSIITPLIYILFGVALVYFFAGVIKYIAKGGDEDDRRVGRNMMIYGLIALFVMFSVFGLIKLLADTFPLPTGSVSPPRF